MEYPKLYKLDSKGKTRVWYMEVNGDAYRTYDGLLDGTVKVSGWRIAKPTNVGKANERLGPAQATFEVEASYAKKLKGAYYEDVNDIHLGCRFFEPMLAETFADPKRATQTRFQPGFGQPKLDGMRAIAKIDGIFSREGELVAGAGHIYAGLGPLLIEDKSHIFDGELYNHELKDDFGEIMSLARKANPSPERLEQIRSQVQYHVYDLPSHPGVFSERFRALTSLIESLAHPNIILVETARLETIEQFDELHGICLEAGYEGSMLRIDAPYVNDRTDNLLKRKDFIDGEFELLRIEPAHRGTYRAICQLDDGREFGAGIVGPRAKVAERIAENHRIVTVNFFGFTPDGKPRFGRVTKWHGQERTT